MLDFLVPMIPIYLLCMRSFIHKSRKRFCFKEFTLRRIVKKTQYGCPFSTISFSSAAEIGVLAKILDCRWKKWAIPIRGGRFFFLRWSTQSEFFKGLPDILEEKRLYIWNWHEKSFQTLCFQTWHPSPPLPLKFK